MRDGLTADQRETLRELHTDTVMLRVRAMRFVDEGGRACWVGRCQRCGRIEPLETAHVEPKGRAPHLRWLSDNALALCHTCHEWGHANPTPFQRWTEVLLGPARELLARLAHDPTARAGDYVDLKLVLTAERIRLMERNRKEA